MSNATIVHLHHKLLISSQFKVVNHAKTCPLCGPVNACDKQMYLVGELHAAMGVYQDSIRRWLAKAPKANEGLPPLPDVAAIHEIPECSKGCE